MSVLEIKRGRCTELHGIKCDICEGAHTSFASYTVWVIGRPLLQVCSRHRTDAEQMWAGAQDTVGQAA